MNMIRKFLVSVLTFLFVTSVCYPLSTQEKQWADDIVVAHGTDDFSQWFEIKNYHFIDYTVLSSVGSGTVTVQYASDLAKQSIIDDPTGGVFATSTPSKLFGGGVTAFFTRIKVSCTAGPCTYDGWFVAKGEMP